MLGKKSIQVKKNLDVNIIKKAYQKFFKKIRHSDLHAIFNG
jgi:hypothetical protein